VLAHVFGVLAGASINVEEVENIIYHGAHATLARIHLDGQPEEAALKRIREGNQDIISAELSEIDGRPPRNGKLHLAHSTEKNQATD
jgi:hypothetical protein